MISPVSSSTSTRSVAVSVTIRAVTTLPLPAAIAGQGLTLRTVACVETSSSGNSMKTWAPGTAPCCCQKLVGRIISTSISDPSSRVIENVTSDQSACTGSGSESSYSQGCGFSPANREPIATDSIAVLVTVGDSRIAVAVGSPSYPMPPRVERTSGNCSIGEQVNASLAQSGCVKTTRKSALSLLSLLLPQCLPALSGLRATEASQSR